MSIILDALNKLESLPNKEGSLRSDKPKKEKKKFLLYFISVILGLTAARIVFTALPRYLSSARRCSDTTGKRDNPAAEAIKQTPTLTYRPPAAETKQTPAILKAAVKNTNNKKRLILNGIAFSSTDQSYAIVNNKIVKNGDAIDGFNVLSIKETEVELQSDDADVIKLSFNIK